MNIKKLQKFLFLSALVASVVPVFGMDSGGGRKRSAFESVDQRATKRQRIEKLDFAVFKAAGLGDLNRLRYLIEKCGGSVDSACNMNGSALVAAAAQGHLPIVKYLVEHGAIDLEYAFFRAAACGHLDVVRYFIQERNFDVNSQDEDDDGTALIAASDAGCSEIVNYLLTQGANPRIPDEDGTTALMAAAMNSHVESFCTLMHYLDVTLRNDKRAIQQALLLAGRQGHVGLFREFFKRYSINIDHEDRHGNILLHDAAANGRLELVRILLSAGASINVQNRQGFTALHYAAFYGQAEVVRALLQCGANAQIQAGDGETPLHYLIAATERRLPLRRAVRVAVELLPHASLEIRDKEGRIAEEVDRIVGHGILIKAREEIIRGVAHGSNIARALRDMSIQGK